MRTSFGRGGPRVSVGPVVLLLLAPFVVVAALGFFAVVALVVAVAVVARLVWRYYR